MTHICQNPKGLVSNEPLPGASVKRIAATSSIAWKAPITLGRIDDALHMEMGKWYVGLMPSAWTLLGPENSFGMTAVVCDKSQEKRGKNVWEELGDQIEMF